MSTQDCSGLDRRRFLGVCSAAGLGKTLLPGVLLGMVAARSSAQDEDAHEMGTITAEMIDGSGGHCRSDA